MGSRKRGRDEMESSEPAPEKSLLDKIRSTWEFANIMQYIFIFGKAVKIDEDLTSNQDPRQSSQILACHFSNTSPPIERSRESIS